MAEVTSFKSFKKKRKSKYKRPRPIHSWTRNIIAPRDLMCSYCDNLFPIFAGDFCIREVWVDVGHLDVRYRHDGACPDDPPEEKMLRKQENIEAQESFSNVA